MTSPTEGRRINSPTLHDLARYYRNGGLVGEDRAGITASIALAGDASVVVLGLSGTGKTQLAKNCVALLPESQVCRVDMVSALGIWSKDMAERIEKARVVFFPEQQNAGDNDEVVKVVKKWGDGDDAERAKSAMYGRETEITVLPCRTFVSTAAITNEAHERSFDAESARRVVKVSTNPSEAATARVLKAKAEALVKGRQNVRHLTPLEEARVKKHVAEVMTKTDGVTSVRFFGAPILLGAIPMSFPEARSAFALFEKILLGVARFYADEEVRVGTEVFLSPQRVAEAWSFYGDILVANALKWDTSDREILSAFPAPKWNGEAPAPETLLDLNAVLRKLKPFGLTDPALVKRQIAGLVTKGFLAEAEGLRTSKWHKTDIAGVANVVDWAAVIKACREAAPIYLQGADLEAYLAKCDQASGPKAIQNPITGEVGPILGDKSVLYHDAATGEYVPIGAPKAAAPRGITAW